MSLRRACELLIESRDKGNQVDFWRAVGLIAQAMSQLKALETTPAGRFRIDRTKCFEIERWELLDNGVFVLSIEGEELHQLAGEALLADVRGSSGRDSLRRARYFQMIWEVAASIGSRRSLLPLPWTTT